jgi:hypothetical protein
MRNAKKNLLQNAIKNSIQNIKQINQSSNRNKQGKILASFILGLTLLSSTTLLAQPHDNGAYVEANIGSNYSEFHLFHTSYSEFYSIGVNTNIGYQLFRYFAIEAGATTYGRGLYGVDAALKLIAPFTTENHDFTLFGKIGAGYIFDNNGRHYTLPFLGLGASYALAPCLDVNVQAQGVTVGFMSLGLLSAGLTYYF